MFSLIFRSIKSNAYSRGKFRLTSKLPVTFVQILRKVSTLPVKLTAAKCGDDKTFSLYIRPEDGRKLITPSQQLIN
jgi:hypothetical protein